MDATELEADGASSAEVYRLLGKGQVTVGQGYADEDGHRGRRHDRCSRAPPDTRSARVAGIVETIFAGGQTVGMSLKTMRAGLRGHGRLRSSR